MYAAPHVTDNTAVWAFGEGTGETVSSGIFFGGTAGINNVIAGNNTVYEAVLDTTQFTLDGTTKAAAIRLAANQVIDFTGDGTAADENQRFLVYIHLCG